MKATPDENRWILATWDRATKFSSLVGFSGDVGPAFCLP